MLLVSKECFDFVFNFRYSIAIISYLTSFKMLSLNLLFLKFKKVYFLYGKILYIWFKSPLSLFCSFSFPFCLTFFFFWWATVFVQSTPYSVTFCMWQCFLGPKTCSTRIIQIGGFTFDRKRYCWIRSIFIIMTWMFIHNTHTWWFIISSMICNSVH